LISQSRGLGDVYKRQGCKRSDTNPPKIIPATAYKRGEFDNYKEFPYTIQLSKYYKLGDLANVGSESAAKNRAFWNDPKQTQFQGLTKPQILDNLRGLAVNVLDPIKERFPGVQFTSLMRFDVPHGGSAKSQHLLGQAVDMQINGVKGAYEAALWIRDNVAYDQLLLEFWNKPGGGLTAWVHCSFNPSGNRGAGGAKVGTFMDHKVATGPDGKPKWFLCDLSK
jgi:zinc D-Ala-D-Ala carboxypeptidase